VGLLSEHGEQLFGDLVQAGIQRIDQLVVVVVIRSPSRLPFQSFQ